MKGKLPARLDMVLGTVLLVGLALPFVPVPGDGTTIMNVVFRTAGMKHPHGFATPAPRSVCRALAMSLAFEDPVTGDYTRIACPE